MPNRVFSQALDNLRHAHQADQPAATADIQTVVMLEACRPGKPLTPDEKAVLRSAQSRYAAGWRLG